MTPVAEIARSFSHLFFPDICYGCGRETGNHKQLLCLRCLHQLPYTQFHLHRKNPVEQIFWGRIRLHEAASLFYFTKASVIGRLLHQLKYKGKKDIGIFCGRMMGQALKESDNFGKIDALIPLPLFKSKERKRGYNQSRLICDGIAEVSGIPVWNNVIERLSATETQTRKNRIERWDNMKDRFLVIDAERLQNKHVLLVDDVITTGATLESCASALQNASNVEVSIFALAYSASKNV